MYQDENDLGESKVSADSTFVPGFGSDSSSYLGARLNVLRQNQNSDGGWGYFP